MPYIFEEDKDNKTTREKWNDRPIDFETDLSTVQVTSLGGTITYGKGGRWVDENCYIAINGYKSQGAVPYKLKTSDGEIPLSKTDKDTLLKHKKIRTYKK